MKLATISAALSLLVSATALGQSMPSSSAPVAVPAPPQTSAGGQAGPETLTASGSAAGMRPSGWFLAPTIGTTVFDDRVRYLPGLRGGFYLNKKFAVGVAAHGVVGSDAKVDGDEIRNLGSYGGLLLQYVWRSDQLIHGTIESTLGDGRWCAAGADGSDACSHFMVLEPAANVEINLARHVRVATGVGYRLAVTGGDETLSSRDVSGLVIRSSLIFGSF
jgi:hypothetical protein